MMTQFANLNARASSARHRCTALASRPSSCRCVPTSASGRFSKKSDSSRKKCSRRQQYRDGCPPAADVARQPARGWVEVNSRKPSGSIRLRSEEHTSELQSPYDLVCRLLLEKKKKKE